MEIKIDVWSGPPKKRDQELVDTIAAGKRVMRKRYKEGKDAVVMYHVTSPGPFEDDPTTITYFFKDGKIVKERI
jgi:hypothetical protein